jgi:hypothetical protein
VDLLSIAGPNSTFELVLGAEISVNLFTNENWLESSIAKDYSCSEQAIDDGE